MRFKRALATFVTVFFCSTIVANLSGIKVYAQTLNPFTTQISVNGVEAGSNNTVNLTNGQTVGFDLNISVNDNAKPGDKLVFTLPKGFQGAWVAQYPKNAFSKCTVDGNTVTLVAGPQIGITLGAYLKIESTLKVDKNSSGQDNPGIGITNIPISINGTTKIIKANISNPTEKPVTPDHQGSGSGSGTDTGGQGIQHIIKSVNGNEHTNITNVTSQNNTLSYSVTLNTKDMEGPITFTDPVPKELQLQNNTISVVKVDHGIQFITNQLINSKDLKIKGNTISITGLQKNTMYVINYQAVIPLKYADTQADSDLTNTAYLNKYSSSALVTMNTARKKLTPYDISHMISKQSNISTFAEVGNNISYRLTINPNYNYLNKSNFVDKMPYGLQILPNANDIQIIALTSQGLLSGLVFNVTTIDKQGVVTSQTNYPDAEGNVYVDAQKNEIYGQINNCQSRVSISYTTQVTKLLGSITNDVSIKFDGHTASSSATVDFSASAGSIQAWKTVNKATLVAGENDDVQYQIHVVPNGGFPKGYLNITDPLEKGIILKSVEVPQGFTYKVEGNKVMITNSSLMLEPGQNIVVKLNCSLAHFADGTTIYNQAIINHLKTRKVSTKKGYAFSAIKADKQNPNNTVADAVYGVYTSNNTLLVTIQL